MRDTHRRKRSFVFSATPRPKNTEHPRAQRADLYSVWGSSKTFCRASVSQHKKFESFPLFLFDIIIALFLKLSSFFDGQKARIKSNPRLPENATSDIYVFRFWVTLFLTAIAIRRPFSLKTNCSSLRSGLKAACR